MISSIDSPSSKRVDSAPQASTQSIRRSGGQAPQPSDSGVEAAKVQSHKAARTASVDGHTEETPLLGPSGSERRGGVVQGAIRAVRRVAGGNVQQMHDPERGASDAHPIAPAAANKKAAAVDAAKPAKEAPPTHEPLSEHSSFKDFEHYILRIGNEDIGYSTSLKYRAPKYLKQTLEVVRDGAGIVAGVGASMGIATLIHAPTGYLFDSTLGRRIGSHLSTTVDTISTGERPIGQEFKDKWLKLKEVLTPMLAKLGDNEKPGADRLSNFIDFCATEFTKLTRSEEVTSAHLEQPKTLMLRLAWMACAATLKVHPVILGKDDPQALEQLNERLDKMEPDLAAQIRALLITLQNSGGENENTSIAPVAVEATDQHEAPPLLMWPDRQGGLQPFEWPQDSANGPSIEAMCAPLTQLNAFIMRGPGGGGKTSLIKLIERVTGLPVMPVNLAATTVNELRGPQRLILTDEPQLSIQEIVGILADQIVRSGYKNCILFLDESDLSGAAGTDLINYLKQTLQDDGAILDIRALGMKLDARRVIWMAASNSAIGDPALAQRIKELFFRGLSLEEKDSVAWTVLTQEIRDISKKSGRVVAAKVGEAFAPAMPELIEMDAHRNYSGRVIKDVIKTIAAGLEDDFKRNPGFKATQADIVKRMETAYLAHRTETDIYFKVTRNERSDAINLVNKLINDAEATGANIDVRSLKDVSRYIFMSRVGRNDHALLLIAKTLANRQLASTIEQCSAIFLVKGLAEVCKRAAVDAINTTLPLHKALRHLTDAIDNGSVKEPGLQIELLEAMQGIMGALPADNSRKQKTLATIQQWVSGNRLTDANAAKLASTLLKGDKGKAVQDSTAGGR